MAERRDARLPSLDGLVGSPVGEVWERFGDPEVDRRVDDERWLIYRRRDLSLRVRCRRRREGGTASPRRFGDAATVVASWTASHTPGCRTLREAAEPLGLWPACAPDETASDRTGLIRRPLPDPGGRTVHSLTATVRGGRIVQITAFDEPPDWLPAGRGDEGR